MADWTTLPDTAVGIGGLPSGATVTALRDNPVAIAQGAAGAPRIIGNGVATIPELIPLPVVASNNRVLSIGLVTANGTLTTNSATFVTARTIVVNAFQGVIRFVASHERTSFFGASELRLLKNGSIVQTFSTTGSSQRILDVPVSPGDEFIWQHRHTESGSSSVVSGLQERADKFWQDTPVYRGE